MAGTGVVTKKRRSTGVGRSYRNKTLRQMPPVTRKLARLRGELASVDHRLKALVLEIKEVERVARLTRADSIKVFDRIKAEN